MALIISKQIFKTIKAKQPFGKRPYSFIFLRRAGYTFLDNFINALASLGLCPYVINIPHGMTKGDLIHGIMVSIATRKPDFVLTFSHNGVDAEGDLTTLLADLNIPLVSWFLDNPIFILAPYSKIINEHVVVLLSDGSLVNQVRSCGYAHVHYLPLAARTAEQYPANCSIPARFGEDKLQALFVGDSFLAKAAACLQQTRGRNPLLGRYKKLARAMMEGKSLEIALQQDAIGQQSFHQIEDLQVKTNVSKLVHLYATALLRASRLKELLPYKHLVVGPGDWRCLVLDKRLCLAGPTYNFNDIAALFKNSAITLNVTSLLTNGAANERIFDVPMAGGFLLTDDSRQVAEMFDLNDEIVMYENTDGLLELLARYGRDDVARERIRQKAVKRILHEHTYLHRAASLLKIVKSAAATM